MPHFPKVGLPLFLQVRDMSDHKLFLSFLKNISWILRSKEVVSRQDPSPSLNRLRETFEGYIGISNIPIDSFTRRNRIRSVQTEPAEYSLAIGAGAFLIDRVYTYARDSTPGRMFKFIGPFSSRSPGIGTEHSTSRCCSL